MDSDSTPRIGDLRIAPAPAHLHDQILEASQMTLETHRQRHPYAFSENMSEVVLEPLLELAFSDLGQPLDESPNIFAAFQGNDFVGYIHLSDDMRIASDAHCNVTIQDIYVGEAYRRSGVAQAMVTFAKDLADAKGWDNLDATVWAGNTASERLFASMDFTPQSQKFRYGPMTQTRPLPVGPRPARWAHWRYVIVHAFALFGALTAGAWAFVAISRALFG